MKYIVLLLPLLLCNCASVHQEQGWFPAPGMHEDGQDRTNTKYNQMDSSDGSHDPTAKVKVWGAVY